MKGKFVTLEGCEGVGKSKQLRLLKEYLDEQGIAYVSTREPGGGDVSERIRDVLLDVKSKGLTPVADALLFAAARAQHAHDVILPALEQGKLVLCDRYIDSSYAYQGYAGGLGFEYIEAVNARAVSGAMPDLTLFLDLPPERAFMRKGGADKNDRMESEGLAFHKKVYEGYLAVAEKFPERIVKIDCSGEVMKTQQNIRSALRAHGVI